jgi:hypothetical protein
MAVGGYVLQAYNAYERHTCRSCITRGGFESDDIVTIIGPIELMGQEHQVDLTFGRKPRGSGFSKRASSP